MVLTWKQRLSRVLGAYTLGLSSGFSISMLDQTQLMITMFNMVAGGFITALPQIRWVFDDYGGIKTSR